MTHQLSHKHHTIPRLYLKNFAIDSEPQYVWRYTKGSERITKSPIRKASVITDYYSYINESGLLDDSIERDFLGRIENDCESVFRKMVMNQQLTDRDRLSLSEFIAVMILRVKNFRDSADVIIDQIIEEKIANILEDRDRLFQIMGKMNIVSDDGSQLSFEDACQKIRELLNNRESRMRLGRELSLMVFRSFPKAVENIFNLNWQLYVSSRNYRFVTSDNPVSLVSPDAQGRLVHGAGLLAPGLELTIPVSKHLALVAGRFQVSSEYVEATNKIVKEVNRRTMISASEFIYASQNIEVLRTLTQKFQGSAPRFTLESVRATARAFEPPGTA